MSNKKKVDLRIQRSRASMQEALATLMTEKTYEKIKVSEITDRAYVARPTFYLHFKTKDELLLSVIDEFFEQFLADFDAYLADFPENFEGLLKFILQEWAKHASIIQMIIKAGREILLLERFQQYTELAVDRITASERFTVDIETLQYAGDILAGSMFVLATRWVRDGMPHSAEKVSQFYYEILHISLERLLQGEFNSLLE